MTDQEAIDLLNQEKVPMVLNGKNNEQLAVAHIKAIEALEKQIPKKPTDTWKNNNERRRNHMCRWACPDCGTFLGFENKHCTNCGTKIDWDVIA